MPTFRNTLSGPSSWMEQTVCSEMSAYKIQMPWNCPEESMQHSEHGKSLKSRIVNLYSRCVFWLDLFDTIV